MVAIPVQNDGYTGTKQDLYRYRGAGRTDRGSGLLFRRAYTGTRVDLYRYSLADFENLKLQGPFGILLHLPQPLGLLPLTPFHTHTLLHFLEREREGEGEGEGEEW